MHKVSILRTGEVLGATLGLWYFNSELKGTTLELSWVNNQPQVSCIPLGLYLAKPHKTFNERTQTWRSTFQLRDVPGRSGINFDIANTASEIRGCFALGLTHGTLKGKPAVLSSEKANQLFLALAGSDPLQVEVLHIDSARGSAQTLQLGKRSA